MCPVYAKIIILRIIGAIVNGFGNYHASKYNSNWNIPDKFSYYLKIEFFGLHNYLQEGNCCNIFMDYYNAW